MEEEDDFLTGKIVIHLTNRKEIRRMLYAQLYIVYMRIDSPENS